MLKIKIEEIPAESGYKRWFFLDYEKKEESHFKARWIIERRERDDWWGVVAAFPYTNEKALDRVIEEMKLAKKAIAILKKLT